MQRTHDAATVPEGGLRASKVEKKKKPTAKKTYAVQTKEGAFISERHADYHRKDFEERVW